MAICSARSRPCGPIAPTRGGKTSAEALGKCLDAAKVDPDHFDQSVQIYLIARYLDREEEQRAVEQLWARATSLEERAFAADACAKVHLSPGKWCNKAWTREQYMGEVLRLRREIAAAAAGDLYPQLMLATTIVDQSEYKIGRDEPGGRAMLREAYGVLDDLRRSHLSSSLVEIRHFDVGIRVDIGLASPERLARARALEPSPVWLDVRGVADPEDATKAAAMRVVDAERRG